jgi:hypothetical protein
MRRAFCERTFSLGGVNEVMSPGAAHRTDDTHLDIVPWDDCQGAASG